LTIRFEEDSCFEADKINIISEHVTLMVEKRNAYRVLVGKPEEKR
jgi:hypothetical protein